MSYNWHARMNEARRVAEERRAMGKLAGKAHASHVRKVGDYAPEERKRAADPLDVENIRAGFRAVTDQALEDFRWAVFGADLLETFK